MLSVAASPGALMQPSEQDLGSADDAEFDLFVSSSRMAGFCLKAKSRCARAGVLGRLARKRSRELFPSEAFPGNEADVFRHVYWHALMMIEGLPEQWVEEFGEQWEIWPGNRDKARIADLENNAFGRRVGRSLANVGLGPGGAMQQAEVLISNMVRSHGPDLNFDF
ncbi:MAG: DUF6973 domain-containing protein [Acidimicrobiia bacterium]